MKLDREEKWAIKRISFFFSSLANEEIYTVHSERTLRIMLLLLLFSCQVVSYSLRPHGLYPTRLLCPWDFPGKNTGMDCHLLLQTSP